MKAIIPVMLLSVLLTACIFNPNPPKSPIQTTPQTPSQTLPSAEQPRNTHPSPPDDHINLYKKETMQKMKVHLKHIDSTSVN